jgi:hypothetical protein
VWFEPSDHNPTANVLQATGPAPPARAWIEITCKKIWFTWTNGSNELNLLLLSRKAQTAKGDTPCEWILSTVSVAGRIIPVVPFHTASSNIGHGVAYRATQAGYKYQIESYNTLTVMKWSWQQRQTTKDIQREWSPKKEKLKGERRLSDREWFKI